jgi:hypothetical protein
MQSRFFIYSQVRVTFSFPVPFPSSLAPMNKKEKEEAKTLGYLLRKQ